MGICRGFLILCLTGLLWLGTGTVGDRLAVAAASTGDSSLSVLRQQAFELTQKGQLAEAEAAWSQLIERLPAEPALWSNRGNVRMGQRQLEAAIADYTEAIRLAPLASDAYLNRGAAWEALTNWDGAIADYEHALELAPQDPAVYNNRGNAKGGQGDWLGALADFEQAITLDPAFSLGYANYALTLYQVGQPDKSLQILRSLVRKYPNFADVRAALTAVLWETGHQGEAESQWVAARGLDRRYSDLAWVAQERRWPPALVTALDHFLHL